MGSSTPWQNEAACRNSPASWFVGDLTSWETWRAKDICARCPVVFQCRDLADEVEVRDPLTRHYQLSWQGVWGGEDPAERRARRGLVLGTIPSYRPTKRRQKGGAHGTPYRYRQHGCRCFECCEANRYACLDYRKRKRAGKVAGPYTPKHGTQRRYRLGCKCDKCKEAKNEYERKRRKIKSAAATRDHVTVCRVCKVPFIWSEPHAGSKPTKCQKCRGRKSKRFIEGKRVPCPICHLPCCPERGLSIHMAKKHPGVTLEDTTSPFGEMEELSDEAA